MRAIEKYNICIIGEGNEEHAFFQTIKDSGVLHPSLDLYCVNAGGFGSVAPLFQDYFSDSLFDCVVCVYDVDYRAMDPSSPYHVARDGLKKVLDREEAVDAVSFCTNPNFLQIYMLAVKRLCEVSLTSTSKETNTPLVHECWPTIAKPKSSGTKGYDATDWQLREMNAAFYQGAQMYQRLLRHCEELSENYLTNEPGSNVPSLISALLSGDIRFFENINKKL